MNVISKILIIFLFFSALQALKAQNIHVAVNGSDTTGTGTVSNPYATITKAANVAVPGDTVFVHGGIYHNDNFGNGDIWKSEMLALITCNGTANAWIVFMPFPGDTVLLEFDAAKGVNIRRSSYVKFAGFHIKGIADGITLQQLQAAWGLYKDSLGNIHDLAQEMGIDITDTALYGQTLTKPATINVERPPYYNGIGLIALSSHHIILENNLVEWTTASGLRVQRSDYTTVKGNEVRYCTMRTPGGVGALTIAESQVLPANDTFPGNKIFILKNKVHDNENQIYSWAPSKSFIHFVIDEGSGIFFTRNSDTYNHGYSVVANNLSYRNGASGIVIHRTDRVLVEHNTVYDNGTSNGPAKPGGLGYNTTKHVTFRNNISWSKPTKFALGRVGANNFFLVVDSNLLFNNNGSEPVAKGLTSGWFEANPQFYNVNADDFRLAKNSPAIDRGYTPVLVADDYLGMPRSDGKPDIGAYELDPTISIALPAEKNQVKVFPNPVQDKLYIRFADKQPRNIRLFNISGKELPLRVKTLYAQQIVLDMKDLPKGIYFLKTTETIIKIIKI
jgi:hypothetical protein